MFLKNVTRLVLLIAVLAVSLASVSPAAAASPCGSTYKVVKGDTLQKIATRCETTVAAMLRANPSIKDRSLIYVGQVFDLPGALIKGSKGVDVYIIEKGDTMRKLAARFGTTVDYLLVLNPDIKNASLIYEGQRLNVPAESIPVSGQVYVVQRGDTLKVIANQFGTTVAEILKLNPQIKDPDLIITGQRILIPDGPKTYTVVRGDTLKKISVRFNTTVSKLLELNPKIKNPDLIYVGQVITLR